MKPLFAFAAALAFATALPAAAQTKWDMPTAYPANNFHTENIQQFANDVDKATGGKLKITVHANASLFKAPEIKRAVQGGQAQIGEILLVNFENEDPFYGIDGIPFLATSYGESQKLYKASRKTLDDKFAKQGMKLLFAVAWPPQGIYTKRTLASGADMKGLKWRAYSPATVEDRRARRRAARDRAGLRALASARDRHRRLLHVLRRDRLRLEDLRAHQEFLRYAGVAAEERGHRQPESVRCARQGVAGGGAQGCGRRRGARLEIVRGEDRLVLRSAQSKGMSIMKPSEQLTADLRKVGNYMLAEWLRKAGDDGRKVIDAYRAM